MPANVEYRNLAGTIIHKQDGNLTPEATSDAPRVVIIGTAEKGQAQSPYLVRTTTLAKAEFGTDGNLVRGMWEAIKAGADEISLYRIGAKPAILSGIGKYDVEGEGITVRTVSQTPTAGSEYSISYLRGGTPSISGPSLIVKRNADGIIVYQKSYADGTVQIDRGEVVVSGNPLYFGTEANIGDYGSTMYIDLDEAVAISGPAITGLAYAEGTDGLNLSRMEMYEALYNAYEHLKESTFDVVVPMDVYLDDYNVKNQGHHLGVVAPKSNEGADDEYPTAGAFLLTQDVDSLGTVYIERYEGTNYFWWNFTGTGDTANVFPVAGSASATQKINGDALVDADFHEVNFAYQLARFLYETSVNIVDATGVIGVLPPVSSSVVDKARWLGNDPTWTQDTQTGEYYIDAAGDNGKGLLGNKFMVGRHDHRNGIFGGGFIATDSKFMDGTELVDQNEIPIDLGKFISVAADYPLLRNEFNPLGYIASFAPSYAGFYSNMNPSSSPTNKQVSNAQIVFRQELGALDSLAGAGYVVLRNKPQGTTIALAPTASMPNSDWRKLSTVRIVKTVVDGVRLAADAFIGDVLSPAKMGAMNQAIENVLMNAKRQGLLRDYRPFQIIMTPEMAVVGRAEISLVLIPNFELTQVAVTVSVAKN